MQKKQLLKEIYATYLLFWLIFTSRKPVGTNVFEKDWDVLVLLDTCRVDALNEVQDEYEFIKNIKEVWSVGSTSKEWIEQTFTDQYADKISETAYITGNPYSNTLLGKHQKIEYGTTYGTWIEEVNWTEPLIKDVTVDGKQVGHIEPLWGETGEDAPFEESQKPHSITNHTIKAARSGDYKHVIAHYMQPHSPYFASSKSYDNLKEYEKQPFKALKEGKKQEVWEAYIDNLRYVLDNVEQLLQNVDGSVVITADHGELMGEQGMYYHMPGNIHPKLRKVPWVQVNATDEETITTDVTLEGIESAEEVSEEQLEALGYL